MAQRTQIYADINADSRRSSASISVLISGYRRFCVFVALLCFCGVVVRAEEIRLKDGTRLDATLLGRDGENVVIAVPRAAVATVNGEPLPPPVVAGATAPAFEVVDLAGATHVVGRSRQTPTLLVFWATWCPHCRADIPLMKELVARYRDQGLRVLAISVDQDLEQLRAFVRDHQLPYPVVPIQGQPGAGTTQSALPGLYEIHGIPAYYLLDRQEMVAQVFSGSVTEGNKEGELERTVQQLLASKAE